MFGGKPAVVVHHFYRTPNDIIIKYQHAVSRQLFDCDIHVSANATLRMISKEEAGSFDNSVDESPM
jgi:hypothetical protein